jgi:hypothetical protein
VVGLFRKRRAERGDQLFIGDPRFDGWETVREFADMETARAWLQQLTDADIPAAITADHELDRYGRGHVYLQVPAESWSAAEELLSGLTDL